MEPFHAHAEGLGGSDFWIDISLHGDMLKLSIENEYFGEVTVEIDGARLLKWLSHALPPHRAIPSARLTSLNSYLSLLVNKLNGVESLSSNLCELQILPKIHETQKWIEKLMACPVEVSFSDRLNRILPDYREMEAKGKRGYYPPFNLFEHIGADDAVIFHRVEDETYSLWARDQFGEPATINHSTVVALHRHFAALVDMEATNG